ncbi:ATP-binding cassette domain-containing protein [Weissella minor]|uniref:ABC transporter ATP-binding protein n=1 Tax=Weissella minor TaxID=1620 RepID=UPI001BAEE6D9|nr:ATP-binding cassette domain-containing protein [Weissella minor]
MLNIKQINVFAGKKKIIKEVSFNVPKGSIVGLVGPNGAGKTTIMKTILGLTKFTGSITLDQNQITENNHKALNKVGALIENPAIYPYLTGAENLKLYAKSADNIQSIVNLLKMDGYINNKSKSYSLGMKQKLGIAIALLNNPEFVILDEPMNGLDIESTILIRKVIKEFSNKGTSFLISSHILGELEKVITDVVLLNKGEIIVNKSINEFNFIDYNKYRLLTNTQDLTKQLLTNHSIKFNTNNDNQYLHLSGKDISKVQHLMTENDIEITELSPKHSTLEDTIVSLLKTKEVPNYD